MTELAALLDKLRKDHDLHLIAEDLATAVLRQEKELSIARNRALEEAARHLELQNGAVSGRGAAATVRQLKRNSSPQRGTKTH